MLVLDLDQTLLHSLPNSPEHLQDRGSGHGIPLNLAEDPDTLFLVPRAKVQHFFKQIMWKYHVYFCTAGSQAYAEAVMETLCKHLLGEPNLSAREREWITNNINRRSHT